MEISSSGSHNSPGVPEDCLSAEERAIIERAFAAGVRQYFAERRRRVVPFVEKHYSLKGALAINRHALGKDLIKAPANLLWAMPYLGMNLSSRLMRRAGMRSLSDVLAKVPPGFRTRVQAEIEWLVRTELFELPFQQGDRHSENDALLSAILAQPALAELMVGYLEQIDKLAAKPGFEEKLARQLSSYTDTRVAAADLACGLLSLSGGAVLFKQLTPGALSTGTALAAALAQHTAVSKFVFGASLGSLYYTVFPATASIGLLAASTGGVIAALGVLAAVSGVITDPLQKRLGLHQRRLYQLIDALEKQLMDECDREYHPKDRYVARIFDLFDLLKSASMGLR